MKIFLLNIAIILITIILLFAVSLFLDLNFIQKHEARKLIVYGLMLVIVFIFVRIVVLFNKGQNLRQ